MQLADTEQQEEVSTYVTSKGAEFKKLADGWTVFPDGTRWSSNQGQMDNLGPVDNGNGIVTNSKATRACDKIAGKLPTIEQYETFKRHFELDSAGYLTDQGRTDLATVFPDMKNADGSWKWFWSSSVHPYNYPEIGFTFYGLNGIFGAVYRVHDRGVSVRCVSTR